MHTITVLYSTFQTFEQAPGLGLRLGLFYDMQLLLAQALSCITNTLHYLLYDFHIIKAFSSSLGPEKYWETA